MKTAIITGASGGIGNAISEILSKEGYRVALIYNKTEPRLFENCTAFQCDVTDYESLGIVYKSVYEKYGRIDAVVNCHGTAQTVQIQDAEKDDIDGMIMTDLTSVIYSCKYAAEYMLKRYSGAILNISSVWGVAGASCESVYSRAKGGIISFTKALAKELGYSGIRVNCISPGVIKTKMLDCYSDEDLRSLAEETPLYRLGTPGDIAETAAFLLSEKASFITGQNITVDGGFIL